VGDERMVGQECVIAEPLLERNVLQGRERLWS
jgi:hypothetical protein